MSAPPISSAQTRNSVLEIFLVFLKLGLTSFGGPIAHLGYFRQEFVIQRRWLNDHAYADLVALCQFLPGPASSQVGIAIGLSRGGYAGALASWLGFTLPSFIALVVFALLLTNISGLASGAWLHGLKVAAVAVVAQALWGMGKSLCPDAKRASLAVASAIVLAFIPGIAGQVGVIVMAGIIGWLWLSSDANLPHSPLDIPVSKRTGTALLGLLSVALVVLPLLATEDTSYLFQLFDSFFRAGALVFGGGHVVLPLLQAETVPQGWVSNDMFLAGYGAAQAVPGPLFTFAGYLGAVSTESPNVWVGGLVALVAIFLPAFLLILGALPLWETARRHPAMQRAMLGINAAVVGLLLAAFYHPVWTSGILSALDFALAAFAFLLLAFWKSPPWIVVISCAVLAGLGWH
jgi:chromate transporter